MGARAETRDTHRFSLDQGGRNGPYSRLHLRPVSWRYARPCTCTSRAAAAAAASVGNSGSSSGWWHRSREGYRRRRALAARAVGISPAGGVRGSIQSDPHCREEEGERGGRGEVCRDRNHEMMTFLHVHGWCTLSTTCLRFCRKVAYHIIQKREDQSRANTLPQTLELYTKAKTAYPGHWIIL